MYKIHSIFIFFLMFISLTTYAQKEKVYKLSSPQNTITVNITVSDNISYTVFLGGKQIIEGLPVSMELENKTLGKHPKVASTKYFTKKETISGPFYKFAQIESHYNMLDIRFKENYGLIFAANEEGIAYRFYTQIKDSIIIKNETCDFKFDQDYQAYIPYVRSNRNNFFQSSFQSVYEHIALSAIDTTKIAFLPVTVDLTQGVKLTIAESDLEAYPGMFLKYSDQTLSSVFAPYPAETFEHSTRCQEMISKSENFIAKTKGNRNFPWRILIISTNDTQLPVNNMVYELAGPNKIKDYSWIKPGKIAWDWWNNWGIYGVDFEVGINNNTYKYYIDFASENNIEYVVLDEGWSVPSQGDIMTHIPEIDLLELIEYANERNVSLILWVVGNVLDKKLEEACKYYSSIGIKGFKVDFFDRDDQPVMERIYRIAQKCADYKLVLDLHGVNKPAGLNRTYPNIVNFEGVFGLEELKWDNVNDMIAYDVTVPYIRMLAGPIDYTQGAMQNAVKKDFRAIYSSPMSQGTRAHQLATYIVFDSPLVTLCDSPTEYIKNEECTEYICSLPTVFEFTKIIDGKLGEFIITLRKAGDTRYIGGLNNWDKRNVTIDFSFLDEGNFIAEIFKDGLNAHRKGNDYKKEQIEVTKDSKLEIEMAPGGGFAMSIYPKN